MAQIHTFNLELSEALINLLSKIDRFGGSWDAIEKRERNTLKQLKAIATVSSIGASTRIEGSNMTDKEVEVLIGKLKRSKLEERDQQEVAGYFDVLDTITESFKNIEISEGNIKHLHNNLMRYAEKDQWHKGNYKQVSNAVEANEGNRKQIIFKTTEPGYPTEDAMRRLFEWYHGNKTTHPVIKTALFVYEFLSIHPFQDGNGRLSRLLATLLLLRHGYTWVQYVSFEHEIESRKGEYYKVLMRTQQQRPGERVDEWVEFFLSCMLNIQHKLMNKLTTPAYSIAQLAPKEKNILTFIENHPGSKSSEIANKLDIPLSTVKKILTTMVENKLILKYGSGAGTNYVAEEKSPVKKGMMFQLTNTSRKKDFLLIRPESYIEINRIILAPLFEWKAPDDWSKKMINHGLYFKVTGHNNRGDSFSRPYFIETSLYHFEPTVVLSQPIRIPSEVSNEILKVNEYPIKIEIELIASVPKIEFDVMFIYDEVN